MLLTLTRALRAMLSLSLANAPSLFGLRASLSSEDAETSTTKLCMLQVRQKETPV